MSAPCSEGASLDVALLHRLAEGIAATDPTEALLVRLRDQGGRRLEVGLQPMSELDPLASHPVQLLLGFEAPADWLGLGIVATGRARALHPAAERGGPSVGPVRVAVCHLATRDGLTAHAIHRQATGAPPPGTPHPGEMAQGRIPDLLQRSLGRPTAGSLGPGHWIDQRWLDAMLARAASSTRTPTWSELAALHPLAADLYFDDVDPGLARARTLRATTRQLDRLGWDRLLAADPASVARAVDFPDPASSGPRLLEWVGGTTVGHWLMLQLPAAAELFDGLASLVADTTLAPVRAALLGEPPG